MPSSVLITPHALIVPDVNGSLCSVNARLTLLQNTLPQGNLAVGIASSVNTRFIKRLPIVRYCFEREAFH
jgi:hypothetical protein